MEARMAELSVGTDNSPPLADTVLLLERRVRSRQLPPPTSGNPQAARQGSIPSVSTTDCLINNLGTDKWKED